MSDARDLVEYFDREENSVRIPRSSCDYPLIFGRPARLP